MDTLSLSDSQTCTFKMSKADFKSLVSLLPQKKQTPKVNFRAIFAAGNTTMCSTGIASSPMKDFVSIGQDSHGKTIYGMSTLLKATKDDLGANRITIGSDIFNHLGVFRDSREKKRFDKLEDIVVDKSLWKDLTKSVENKNITAFMSKVLTAFGQGVFGDITWNVTSQNELETAMSAYLLYCVWDRISGAQKSLALSAIGTNAFKFSNGDMIKNRYIISPSKGNPGISLEDAFKLLQKGVNSFSLIRHWSQLNILNHLGGGAQTATQIANFSNGFSLLGQGLLGSAIFVTPGQIEANGFNKSPQFGIGALYSQSSQVQGPQGYKTLPLKDNKGTIAIPPQNVLSTAGATGVGSLIGMPGGKASVSEGTFAIYKNWPKADKPQKYNSQDGGSALAGGLEKMVGSNPYLISGMIAATMCDNFSQYPNIEGLSTIEYLSLLSGVALSRVMSGLRSPDIDEKGAQLGKLLSTNKSFDGFITDAKTLYAQKGIKSKADAYQLSNQAYGENRLNETDTVVLQQVFSIIYDSDGMKKAQNLMAGRLAGFKAMRDTDENVTQIIVIGGDEFVDNDIAEASAIPRTRQKLTKQQLIQKNRQQYGDRIAHPQDQDIAEVTGGSASGV